MNRTTKDFSKQECDASTHHTFLHELATVPEDIEDLINAPIRESEVQRAIKKLSGNKAPGPDGIGAEFYKRYADLLCPTLVEVY